MQADRVLLVEPRGFCAGVEMAVKALGWLVLLADGRPVRCYHHVVHNEHVVARFRRLGVEFVDDLAAVPPGALLLLSAHGTAPDVAASAGSGISVDAVCPLVAKVHHELRARAAAGDRIAYVGHAGHDEAVGALGVAPASTVLVRSPEDLPADDVPTAVLAQTTLHVEEWEAVVEEARRRYSQVWVPPRSDLCYATTNRQAAVRSVAPRCDAFVVVGSATSANTAALAGTAWAAGCPAVVRVDGPGELPPGLAGTIGVTAGASAPESSVRAVVEALGGAVERVQVAEEHAYFPPPPDLRRLLAGNPMAEALLARDRELTAEAFLDLVEAAEARRAA